MGSREEEYLRRMKALGYEPRLNGMDDEDIEWELSKMEEADRRREAEWQQPQRTVYRPVDPGLKARILRQFGQPYDESAIPKGQEFYLNGWDNGEEEEWPEHRPEPRVPTPPGSRRMKPDLHGITYDPETGKITPNENGGFEIKGWELSRQRPFWKNAADIFSPSRGDAFRPLSYTAGGNDVNTGGRGANTAAANPYAGGYADGGAYGDMTLPEGTQQPATEGAGMKPSDKLVGFLVNYEQLEKKAYLPTPSDSLTIGFGHKIRPGEDFSKGISEDDAWKLFKQDIQEHADAINQWAADYNLKLTQQQFDALVSLRFNMGSLEGAPKLRSLIISGNATPEQIRREFEDIISDKEGPQPGLWRRRRDEANMFFQGDYRRTYPTPPKELFPNYSE